MESVEVVVGMAVAVIVEIEPAQNAINIKKYLIEPASPEDGAVAEFVGSQSGKERTDSPMSDHCQDAGNPPLLTKKV